MNFLLGFVIGAVSIALYLNWFLSKLKRMGYITFDATDKLLSEFKINKPSKPNVDKQSVSILEE